MARQNYNPSNSYHIFHQSPSSILAYVAFLVSCTIISVLCELNRYPWNQNMVLQNLTTASFCVYAAALYVTYMLITASLRLVLSYVENAYHYQYDERMRFNHYEDEDDEDDEDNEDDEENQINEMSRVLLKQNDRRAALDKHVNQRNKVQDKNEDKKEGKCTAHDLNDIEEKEEEILPRNNNTSFPDTTITPDGYKSNSRKALGEEDESMYEQCNSKREGRSTFTRFFKSDLGMYYPFHQRTTTDMDNNNEDNDELLMIKKEKNDRKNMFSGISRYFHDRRRELLGNKRRRLPRSVIISSMYLGGSGAYLAIAPLCMWDFTMSASFIAALLFISCVDTQKIDCDFKPDVDTAGAIKRLKWMRRSFHFCAFVSILLILGLDTQEEIEYYIVPMFSSPLSLSVLPQSNSQTVTHASPLIIQQLNPPMLIASNNNNNRNFSGIDFQNSNESVPSSHFSQTETIPTQKVMVSSSYNGPTTMNMITVNNNNNAVVLEGHTGLAYKWPLIILSASSPMFLRAGGGGVSNFYFSLPPSQTLETGLPVSTILAILVLCWHNPNEKIIYDIQGMINLKTAIPMFVICPMCVAAALAFILYGFKKRSSGIIAVVLLLILCIRQQISSQHHLKSNLDWITLGNTINTVILVVSYILYRHNILLPPHQRHTWNKKPVVVLVDSKENKEKHDNNHDNIENYDNNENL